MVTRVTYWIKEYILSLWHVCIPPLCISCGQPLAMHEDGICAACQLKIPFTYDWKTPDGTFERSLSARIPLVRAAALVYYIGDGVVKVMLHSLKYHDNYSLGFFMGRIMALYMKDDGVFDGVDYIVPIPLSRRRFWKRGYNQSELLARGISQITGIPVETNVVRRKVNNPTQTRKNAKERQENVSDIFELTHPERVRGKHIMIIDDVITTGATMLSCANVLLQAGDVRFSIVAFAHTEH